MKLLRRDFLKGLVTVPFLGYFAFGFKDNITKQIRKKSIDYNQRLKIDRLEAPYEKLVPPTGNQGNKLRIGLVGNGWRGEQLLQKFGYLHPDIIKQHTTNGEASKWLRDVMAQEDLNVEITGICDVFDVHTQRGVEISRHNVLGGNNQERKAAEIFQSYRDMVKSDNIDAIVIATADHSHAPIAIAAAKAGKHVYLEKPMTHSIEEAIELRDTIKQTGVVFQLGHQNRQQMSYKVGRELVQKGLLGEITQVETYTNRNTLFGAWIRDDAFDHKLGNESNINWEEFLCNAPWHEFDLKRFFSWQRYSDYGTSVTGNDFAHWYDCVNQVLDLGIPESVVALGGQYYYKTHGDMPDVLNVIFSYPEKGLSMTYDATLKNGNFRQSRILGSEASLDIDSAVRMSKDRNSEMFKDVKIDSEEPLYYYEPRMDIDAVSTATSRAYFKGGYGPTFIDGRIIDVTFLHVKEWIDAIRGHGKPSCDIDKGFEESVTFNLANLAYVHKKPVRWDSINEKAIIG
ncbi:Predicted dehydrogenase [Porphyromonadaceae bacterium KH3R12]|uniref:Gfo/Idh/MocA family protein n=1 Tax=Proteiniphilum saccharofermentans TaxID=1642647 RepID=UPI000895E5F4|nr:Gfo/Idh/MocA family oxidoreductase [Proteiniphilum saccharofermentans]SDZ73447.1 Predicted dehydrogenase [Porphyromonadaceae bacterium KH3R12]